MKVEKVLVLLSVTLVLVIGALTCVWGYLQWDLAKTALLGDTVAPIVGFLSLIAVGAGLWSVRIQHDALVHQRSALEDDSRRRHHATLREVYVPFFAASDAYLDAVREYLRQMSRVDGAADPRHRQDWQRVCKETYADFRRAYSAALLVDTNEERHKDRWPLSREVRLDPWVDSLENRRDWNRVLRYRLAERTQHNVALRDSLQKEFGTAGVTKSKEASEFDAQMLAELQKEAESVDERIGEQLEERARSGSITHPRG